MNLQDRLDWITVSVRQTLRKRGAIVQTSGGIDSSVTLALAARALGPGSVVALFLPDGSSDPTSEQMARLAAEHAGVELEIEDISPATELRHREQAEVVRRYYPDFDPRQHGISLNIDKETLHRLGTPSYLLAFGPRGGTPASHVRLAAADLRILMAIQNRKQRYRMLSAYEAAERRGYAVLGASNGDELETGFVVKYGDDAADLCVIGDLTKTEIYQLAAELQIPQPIVDRTPTTDTFTLQQSQSDYYFGLPAKELVTLLNNPNPTNDALGNLAAALGAQRRYLRVRSLIPNASDDGKLGE